ncbi:MAG: hypothetical protein IT499_16445 [Rubrivivax sp.]|nr:hypothetical protein [Rubrivivax sp.]MCL4698677.1 hypothetical protein [Burkholderiaceae bacterium]
MAAPTPPPSDLDRPSAGGDTPVGERLARARPESTVTLMVQAGQKPGGLDPSSASPAAAPAGPAPQGWWARLRAALTGKR